MKSLLCIALLQAAICLTQAAVLDSRRSSDDVFLNFNVLTDGKLTQEDIEINYEENYVRVVTPALDGTQSMVMIHDYTQDLTLFETNGRCFLMDEYKDIPESINDWLKMEDNAEGGFLDAGLNDKRVHLYKLVPFALNTASLPLVMRSECSDVIQVIVLEKTVQGRDPYREISQDEKTRPVMSGVVYLPPTCNTQDKRVKRSYCRGCGYCRIAVHLSTSFEA